MRKGIVWINQNPFQKSNISLVGESVAIPPINKDNGLINTLTAIPIIIKERFFSLIFGDSAILNRKIVMQSIRNNDP